MVVFCHPKSNCISFLCSSSVTLAPKHFVVTSNNHLRLKTLAQHHLCMLGTLTLVEWVLTVFAAFIFSQHIIWAWASTAHTGLIRKQTMGSVQMTKWILLLLENNSHCVLYSKMKHVSEIAWTVPSFVLLCFFLAAYQGCFWVKFDYLSLFFCFEKLQPKISDSPASGLVRSCIGRILGDVTVNEGIQNHVLNGPLETRSKPWQNTMQSCHC